MARRYVATYGYIGTTVKVHAVDCVHARRKVGRAVATLDSTNVRDAIAEVDRVERLTERGWTIEACACAKL